jgi:hypothetical protein
MHVTFREQLGIWVGEGEDFSLDNPVEFLNMNFLPIQK